MQKSGAKNNAKDSTTKDHTTLVCKCGHSIYLGKWVKLDIQCRECGIKIKTSGGDKDG